VLHLNRQQTTPWRSKRPANCSGWLAVLCILFAIRAMPAAGVAAITAFQMIGLGEHHVRAIEVVVLVFERRCNGGNVWPCRVHRTILSKSKLSCWCFTKPRNYLQISTDIFIFDRGVVPLTAVDLLPGLGPCCGENFQPKNSCRSFDSVSLRSR